MSRDQYVPTYVGTVTKYVFIDSPDVTPQTLAIRAYEISDGLMIKETCFGLQVTGAPENVKKLITELRKVDPAHIFVKDRGFPPGDTRRCRANLGGARPGYYGHEFESGLFRYVSHGLEELEKNTTPEFPRFGKKKLDEGKLPLEKLVEIIRNEEA
ncbi:methanogenesis marker 6 protein [Methanogenium organophilum]|uniref:Methanogenesis marker 6 protein n=1 Tax=Methanogenium organophilum TaxID=2199 RepID=A0A9X9T805_METOG|nr:methanogenesis marker 6 protein [Methanogenium organophilum]WAI00657.1 methanogenesis marker 6 protein [Methanogenium organophilum]